MKSQKNNMWMKILSVVIAVLIWLFVANTNDPVVTPGAMKTARTPPAHGELEDTKRYFSLNP